MKIFRIAFVVPAVFVLAGSEGTGADKTEENLVRATKNYTAVMDRYRKAVSTALDRAEVQARQAGPEQVAAVADQRVLFEKFGFTPAVCSNSLWSQRSSAHKRIVKAFQIAVRDYIRDKEDEKANKVQEKLYKLWPAFLDDPITGGWVPFGSPRVEVENGIVAISPGRSKPSGLVTKRNDLRHANVEFELAASYDINAWVGIQMTQARGKAQGATCQIRAEGGGVKAGFWSKNYGIQEDVGRKTLVKPYDFFTETVHCKHSDFVTEVFVNGKMGSNVGGQTHLQYPGTTTIFVERGVLLVRAASQDGAAK